MFRALSTSCQPWAAAATNPALRPPLLPPPRYWEIDTPGHNIPIRPPFTLDLLSTSGQRLQARLASLAAQDLGVNFSG